MAIEEKYLPLDEVGKEAFKTFYRWSYEDAKQAQEKWINKSKHPYDPDLYFSSRNPFFKWMVAQSLKEMADEYISTGNKEKILEGLHLCTSNQMSIPRWCTSAFNNACDDVWNQAAISWDDVFGKPHPKGTHSSDIRERRKNINNVYHRINDLNIIEGLPIDGNLFERVGRELGIGGKTKTAELYYLAKKFWDWLGKQKNPQNPTVTNFPKK